MALAGERKSSTIHRDLESSLVFLDREKPTGDWRISWQDSANRHISRQVFLSCGRPLYLGKESLSGDLFIRLLQRYVPRFKETAAFEPPPSDGGILSTAALAKQMKEILQANDFLVLPDILLALRKATLAELDFLPFNEEGQRLEFALDCEFPPLGFSNQLDTFEKLLLERKQRRKLWQKLQAKIPSMELVPVLDRPALARASLTQLQKKRLESLVEHNRTLDEIAIATAKDCLEVARAFYQFVEGGLVSLTSKVSNDNRSSGNAPGDLPIVIVDDSPILMKHFQTLAECWGYRVRAVSEASQAIAVIREVNPAMVFIDVNMPEINGFELVKQIRCCSDIKDTPLTILTAENKLSNKWQAKWGNCNFLIKPLTLEETPLFATELRKLLGEIHAGAIATGGDAD